MSSRKLALDLIEKNPYFKGAFYSSSIYLIQILIDFNSYNFFVISFGTSHVGLLINAQKCFILSTYGANIVDFPDPFQKFIVDLNIQIIYLPFRMLINTSAQDTDIFLLFWLHFLTHGHSVEAIISHFKFQKTDFVKNVKILQNWYKLNY
jgi:hypothetical protein